MTKKTLYSKNYDIFDIKSSFFNENEFNLKKSIKINNIYSKQALRTKCKNCNRKLVGNSFDTFKIKYIFCRNCNHVNGIYEDSKSFVNYLYAHKKGINYYKNYFNDFDQRIKKIYNPKVLFLKKIIKNKNKNLNLLDIGSGAGHFLKSCEVNKIKATGFEPNKILCELAQKKLKKNKINNIELDQIYSIVENSNADCLSLIGVLEHLQRPHKLIKSFQKSKIKYLFLSVPLFSLSVMLEIINQSVFPRQLSAAHTHLYTEESINYLCKTYNLNIKGEWWFGADIPDLYRHFLIKSKLKNKNYDKYLRNVINDLQNVLDKNKVCSEVHLILKKKY